MVPSCSRLSFMVFLTELALAAIGTASIRSEVPIML
jgi:hypothetical protein